MTDEITKAIDRLQETRCEREGGDVSAEWPAVDLNDCRTEIVALIAALAGHDSMFCPNNDCVTAHAENCPLLILARRVNGHE